MAPPKKKFSELGRTAKYYRRAKEGLKIKGKKKVTRGHYDERMKQQTTYEKTPKGKSLKDNADKLRSKLGPKPGKHYDAAHHKGSTTTGRWQKSSKNRSRK
jgi:hypothetical protein